MREEAPDVRADSALVSDALGFAHRAHEGPASEGETAIGHPVEVARLLRDQGFSDEVQAAGLLHDVVEDSRCTLAEIADRFGRPVADLVATLTEDVSIEPYEERKADHRGRLADADSRAAAIFAADKLAKVRELRAKSVEPSAAKLDHYRESLRMLRRWHPSVPFLDQLESELGWLAAQGGRSPRQTSPRA